MEGRHNDPAVSHACAVVPLIEGRLRGFQQKARRRSRKVGGFQLLLSGGIKRNATKCLRARPAVSGGNRDRLIKRTERGRGRDFLQEFRSIFFTRTKLGEPGSSGIAEIGLPEALGSLAG